MREVIKAIVRIDNNVGVNSKEIEKISNAFYELSRTFTQAINMQDDKIKKLEQELAKLKQAKK